MSEPAWVPLGGGATPGGKELAYAENATDFNVPVVAETNPTTLFDFGSLTFDGMPITVEFGCSAMQPGSGGYVLVNLWDGNTDLGRMVYMNPAGGVERLPVVVSRKLTPTPGLHNYRIRVSAGAAAGAILGGAAGLHLPIWARITQADVIPNVVPFGAPPLVTALPASPVDGQEVILTDSMTAPTYTWHLRYVAAKASNKWVFVGGTALFSEILTREQVTGAAYADAPTVGPSVTVRVAGLYQLAFGAAWTHSVDNVGVRYIAPKFGAATTDDNDAALGRDQSGAYDAGLHRQIQRTIAAGTLVKLQYRHTTATINFERRYLSIEPVALGG